MELDRNDILARNPLKQYLMAGGMAFTKQGSEYYAKCPFHNDGSRPNFRVDTQKNLWTCDPCGKGGSVIDYVMLEKGVDAGEAMRILAGKEPKAHSNSGGNGHVHFAEPKGKIVATYDYADETGKLLFQTVRFEPKDFSQRHPDGKGGWVWGIKGIRRVLYQLQKVLTSPHPIWITEGEKDADNLTSLGMLATTNPMGGEKWMDGYSEMLKGKEVVICPDNDEKGQAHLDLLIKSLGDYAKWVRVVKVPAPHKDVSDLIKAEGREKAVEILSDLYDKAVELVGGIDLQVYSMEEMERHYQTEIEDAKQGGRLNFYNWLPTLAKCVRPLVPGEFGIFVADTGVGKTCFLQNLALHSGMEVLFFEMELPASLMFERSMQIHSGKSGSEIEHIYSNGNRLEWQIDQRLKRIHVCPKARVSVADIEKIIIKSELKIGVRPRLVIIDYLQLIRGKGTSRYERLSNTAEELKALAKDTRTILFSGTQISRPDGHEVGLHDAKDSGSIENSCGLALGAWRDTKDASIMTIKVLKCTKGKPGAKVDCIFDGQAMTITEKPKIETKDMP